MTGTVAEKRAELEAKLAKLYDPTRISKAERKIKDQIANLETGKEYEGKGAMWDVDGDKACKVPVIINGFKRKAFGRMLFEVSPLGGEGVITVSLDHLEVEGEEKPKSVTPS